MDFFSNIFEKSKENKELIGIIRYSDEESLWCGYILDFNEHYIKLQHYTKFGKIDGIMFIQIKDIKHIDFDDEYCKLMQVVIDYANEIEKKFQFNFYFLFLKIAM
jgi:hypothetical protein